MSHPPIGPITAESMPQDADVAEEHKRPTVADEPSTEALDESVPSGHGGDGGVDVKRRRFPL